MFSNNEFPDGEPLTIRKEDVNIQIGPFLEIAVQPVFLIVLLLDQVSRNDMYQILFLEISGILILIFFCTDWHRGCSSSDTWA